jgi:hypothetical protein
VRVDEDRGRDGVEGGLAPAAVARGDVVEGCGVPELGSQRGIIRICRRNRVLTPYTDDAEKLRG